MMRRWWIWGVPIFLYAAFLLWYTNLGGPLQPEEIEAFVTELQANGESSERVDSLRRFMETDSGRQFLMVNLVDRAERPPDVPGAQPGESAGQLMDRFFDQSYGAFLGRACHPVLAGTTVHRALDIIGVDGADEWEASLLVRYRSRRDMMEIVPTLLQRNEFKLAALEKTIAVPIEPRFYPGDARLLLGLVLFSVTAALDLLLVRRGCGALVVQPSRPRLRA